MRRFSSLDRISYAAAARRPRFSAACLGRSRQRAHAKAASRYARGGTGRAHRGLCRRTSSQRPPSPPPCPSPCPARQRGFLPPAGPQRAGERCAIGRAAPRSWDPWGGTHRMVLQRQLAVGPLYYRVGRALRYLQYVIVVLPARRAGFSRALGCDAGSAQHVLAEPPQV